jgi:hypothetical protein
MGTVQSIASCSAVHEYSWGLQIFFIASYARLFNVTSFLVPLKSFSTFIPKLLGTCSDYQRKQNEQYTLHRSMFF